MKTLIALVLAMAVSACAVEPPLKKLPPGQWITIDLKPRGVCHEYRNGVLVVWSCEQDATP